MRSFILQLEKTTLSHSCFRIMNIAFGSNASIQSVTKRRA